MILSLITLIYILLPIILFVIGWLKLPVAILILLLLAIALYKIRPNLVVKKTLAIDKKASIILALSFIILVVWLAFSGVGGLSYQNYDYEKHNAVLHDLIENDWPVTLEIDGEKNLLVYYTAYYLPAALVGKMFGFAAANVALFVFTLCGLYIGLMWIFRYLNKYSIIPVLLMIIFSGMDIIGHLLFNPILPFPDWHIERWTSLQYSSITTLLYWVPQMLIPALIITPYILSAIREKRNADGVIYLLMTCCCLWAPFILVGLLPFFFIYFIQRIKSEKKIWRVLPWQSVLSCIALSVPLILYFLSNNTSTEVSGFIWEFENMKVFWVKLLLFYFLEFGAMAIFVIYSKQTRIQRRLLWTSILILTLVPLYHVGLLNDFVMRVSVPALIVLYIMFAESLLNFKQRLTAAGSIDKKIVLMTALVSMLLLMSFTPALEITRSVRNGRVILDDWKTLTSNYGDAAVFRAQYLTPLNKPGLFIKYLQK